MKRLKKALALALALTVVMAFSGLSVFAADGDTQAATGDLTVDAKVTVDGFASGDTVKAYQFITWVDGEGWKLADGITDVTLDDITGTITKDTLAKLAKETNKMTEITDGVTTDGKWERTCGAMAKAGSYLILVTANDASHIYNPAIVSADFDGEDGSVTLTNDEALIKKQDVTVEKKADQAPDDYDVQVGDIVPFTVTVTVPQYNDNWTSPTFEVKDQLSTGLTIKTAPTIEGLTAYKDDQTPYDYKITAKGTEGSDGFTITFSESYLKKSHPEAIEIKYSAKVGKAVEDTAQIHEEKNKVTLEFSNNPSNSADHKTIDDETHHYTFAIDASRFGSESGKTSELIKVGIDKNGEPITVYNEKETPTTVSPLAGAEFTLTGVGPNGKDTTVLTATSDADGKIFFNNLEVGRYTLEETKAPAGYIKDQDTHEVVITAEYNPDTTLKSYTITIDGQATSTYTATTGTDGNTSAVAAPSTGNQVFPINNTKGTELPSTGGIGTTIFYIVGAILVVGAGILLISRRRMAAK